MSTRPIVFALIVLFAGASLIPLVSADGGTQPPSHAFLPGWEGNIGNSLNPAGESFANGLEFSNHDFDDQGNLYYIESEDNVNWLDGQYSTYNNGFHILKVDTEGDLEYSEVIYCSQYCTSPDYTYTKVVGMHVVDEDQFYVVLSVYYASLTFGGQDYYTGSTHTLFTAFSTMDHGHGLTRIRFPPEDMPMVKLHLWGLMWQKICTSSQLTVRVVPGLNIRSLHTHRMEPTGSEPWRCRIKARRTITFLLCSTLIQTDSMRF